LTTTSPLAVPATVSFGCASELGDRPANADAAKFVHTPLGAGGALVDGIGSDPDVVEAAHLAAGVSAAVASHRGAQAGLMAAADTMPDHPAGPNAVAAVVSLVDGRIEIAHVGDAAVFTWAARTGLRRWTPEQTVGAHVRYMLTNPALDQAGREALDRVGAGVEILDDYVLNGLKYATVSTVAWTPLRGADADVELIMLTSDGVHKPLTATAMTQLIRAWNGTPQHLATSLVQSAVATARNTDDGEADNATALVVGVPPRR
jgi:serine/threonine protein phosphatase PrpC